MHAISSYRVNRPTNTHTRIQTNPQTGPITIHCAAKLSAQCNNNISETISLAWERRSHGFPPTYLLHSSSYLGSLNSFVSAPETYLFALLRQCLQLRLDFDSTATRPRYDHSTTYVTTVGRPVWAAAVRPK